MASCQGISLFSHTTMFGSTSGAPNEVSPSSNPNEVSLPNGLLVCRLHWLMICSFCAIDLSSRKENEGVRPETYDRSVEDELRYLYETSRDDLAPALPPPPLADSSRQTGPVIDLTDADENESNGHPSSSMRFFSYPFTNKLWLGKGRVVPQAFKFHTLNRPYSVRPSTLFTHKRITPFQCRFVRNGYPLEFLIYVDGAYVTKLGTAGCAFKFHSIPSSSSGRSEGTVSFPLERGSPINSPQRPPLSLERAKLRAILAALRYRDWVNDGFTSLVIAVNSPYIADCGTECIRKWIDKEWRALNSGRPIADSDLWKCILGQVEKLADDGLCVRFWNAADDQTPRIQAALAARLPSPDNFLDVVEWPSVSRSN